MPSMGGDDEATDYGAEADKAEDEVSGDESIDDTEENTDDSTDDTSDTDDSSSDDSSLDSEDDENKNPYDNKQVKNYFLLNSFLSMHQTIVDVLDSTSGIILPNPKMLKFLSMVIKNLNDIKTFIEKFIQFQFNENDYAFNLYYYNILMNGLKMNLGLFNKVIKLIRIDNEKSKDKRRINEYGDDDR